MNKPGCFVPALASVLALPVVCCGSAQWLRTRARLKRFIQGSVELRWQSRSGLEAHLVLPGLPSPQHANSWLCFHREVEISGAAGLWDATFLWANCSFHTQ